MEEAGTIKNFLAATLLRMKVNRARLHCSPCIKISWWDCHTGYNPIGTVLLILGISFQIGSLGVLGIVASLNGGIAMALASRPDGTYSRTVWWLAAIISLVTIFLATMLELDIRAGQIAFTHSEFWCLALASFLFRGQLRFLYRVRRDSQAFQQLVLKIRDSRT